jgi:hypothetical protein
MEEKLDGQEWTPFLEGAMPDGTLGWSSVEYLAAPILDRLGFGIVEEDGTVHISDEDLAFRFIPAREWRHGAPSSRPSTPSTRESSDPTTGAQVEPSRRKRYTPRPLGGRQLQRTTTKA